jgi:hypothetical protein
MKFLHLFTWWMVLLLTDCGLLPIEIPKEQPPEPPPTPALCTPLPENMTIQAIPLTFTSLEIIMTGLQSGEFPVIRIQARTQDGSLELTETPSQPVNSLGQFSWVVHNLNFSSIGTKPPYWNILVIHTQGVACTTVTLPP